VFFHPYYQGALDTATQAFVFPFPDRIAIACCSRFAAGRSGRTLISNPGDGGNVFLSYVLLPRNGDRAGRILAVRNT